MTVRPTQAMILAAGLGTRMRPLTDRTPKPLLELRGRSLMDHAFDRLLAAGVEHVVVNAHWKADQIETHLAARGMTPSTALMREAALLDTGGSVQAALPRLGELPFYVINGDAYWVDGPRPALARLAQAFDPAEVDGVLLVHRAFGVRAEVGFGDFAVDKWGRPSRRGERQVVPYIYAGVQLAAPALMADMPAAPFSMNRAWDRAIASGRLRVVVHDGLWFHLSTPEDLQDAEHMLGAPAYGEAR
jgi:N-acetyl-alpha-D-muramate 1-phosphate uridylyltransferase